MMTGTWFGFLFKQRRVPLAQLARYLGTLRGVSGVLLFEDERLEVAIHDELTGHGAVVGIALDDGPHVAVEAWELAQDPPSPDPSVPLPDYAVLACCDARYELTWELSRSDETYNVMVQLAEYLIATCDAIVFDATDGRFV